MGKKHKHRLVLECVKLAGAVVRLLSKLLDLWDMTSNYFRHANKMGITV